LKWIALVMPESTSGGCQPGDQSFEACLAELQNMVRLLEDGTLGLAESIAGFERGIALLRHCYRTLEQAEQKIEILSGFDQAGNPVTAPFDAAATLEAGQGTAGRRRKKPAAPTPEPVSPAGRTPRAEPEPEPEPGSDLSLPDEGQLF
jgi:exodeoxyribonuclease VII small subunit